MIKNAEKNGEKGLDVSKVVKLIAEIDGMKNPKPSYTVGFDAKVAEIISKLPQSVLNHLIKYGLSVKIK